MKNLPQSLKLLGFGLLLGGSILGANFAPQASALSTPSKNPVNQAKAATQGSAAQAMVAILTRAETDQILQANPLTAADYYDQGLVLQGKGDLPGAIRKFTRAVELEPNADHHFARGLAYMDLGDQQKAIVDFTVAIRLDPTFEAAYYNRGLAYQGLQKLPLAVADFSNAIRINPRFVAAYYSRGMAYFDMGQEKLARADYNQVKSLNPTLTATYYDRAPRPLTGGGE